MTAVVELRHMYPSAWGVAPPSRDDNRFEKRSRSWWGREMTSEQTESENWVRTG